MNGTNRRNMRRERERRLSGILLVLAAVVLFCGLFGQIALRAQISGQAKKMAAVQAEIRTLSANAENLGLTINQRHNLTEIGQKAVLLGMEQPHESQMRVVRLPALNGNTSTQTVANIGGEELNG